MIRHGLAAILVCASILSSGCNGIGGDRGTHMQEYHGDLPILGHQNSVTILPGSDIVKLKVAGDGNTIFVSERVTLGKIEIWGENNTVEIPESLIIRSDIIGKGSRVIRRPSGPGPAPIGPEGEMIRRIPMDSQIEQSPGKSGTSGEAVVEPRDVTPSSPPPADPASSSGTSGGSGTTVTPAGERTIPPAGIIPGGGS